MRKYLQIIKITLEEYFAYRLNFVLWRFRSFIFFLSLLFFWLAAYGNRSEFLGYQKGQILTYVVGIAFLRSIILGSRSADLAMQIKSGEFTKYALMPSNFFGFLLARDLADKLLNVFFTIIEILIAFGILGFSIYFPHHASSIIFFIIISLISIFLYFFISLIVSLVAFWTEEIWAIRWLFGVIFLEFFAGGFFPIDVLPKTMAKIIYLTPFPYLIFFPIKIWLEQLSTLEESWAIMICFFWFIIFFFLCNYFWRKGVKNYGAYGG